jgi:flagellar biosynthesis protein FlhG
MSLRKSRLWTIGSGKGGVGKSFLTASMGIALSRAGKSVVLVDANLAAPNLHTYLGIKAPAITLLDVAEQRASLSDALIQTGEPNLRFLRCVGDEPGMADLGSREVQTFADAVFSLEADFLLLDAGSGTLFTVLDFFNLGDVPIALASPDQASMQSAYSFIRNAVFRRVHNKWGKHEAVVAALHRMRQGAGTAQPLTMSDFCGLLRPASSMLAEEIAAIVQAFRPLLLVNLAGSDQDQRMAEIIQSAAKKFLSIDMQLCGLVHHDPALRRVGPRAVAPGGSDADSPLARQIRQTAFGIAGMDPASRDGEPPTPPAPAAMSTGLNSNLDFMGKDLHIQTEDMGEAARCITTQVFCEGRVILSTKSAYPPTPQDQHQGSQIIEMMRAQHFTIMREIEGRKTRLESVQV